jgi:hypothetical protein
MSILKYSNKCNPAASAANMKYITRDSAADSISFHNLPELEAADRIQAKSNAINYAEERVLEEECRVRGNERGTPRNHNRMIISFDRKEQTEAAKEEVHKFLDKEFSNQKAVVSIHQDGKSTHAHIWFDIRDIDTDRKTQLRPKDFYSLDEKWARQYDERYKTNYEREYQEKKQETREWKKEQAEVKRDGKQPLPENKPHRHNDDKKEILRAKEWRDYGIYKEPNNRDIPTIARRQPEIENTKQRIDRTERTLDARSDAADATFSETQGVLDAIKRTEHTLERTEQTKERAIRGMDGLYREVERLPEPVRVVERSIDRDDGRGR